MVFKQTPPPFGSFPADVPDPLATDRTKNKSHEDSPSPLTPHGMEDYAERFAAATHNLSDLSLDDLDELGSSKERAEHKDPGAVQARSDSDSDSELELGNLPALELDLDLALDQRASVQQPVLEPIEFERDTVPAQNESPREAIASAMKELDASLQEDPVLEQAKTGSSDAHTGSHSVIAAPGESGVLEGTSLKLDTSGKRSPSPEPPKKGLFSEDRVANLFFGLAVALLLGLYPGYESSRRLARDTVALQLIELEGAIEAPLDVAAGELRSPREISQEMERAQEQVRTRFYLYWLGCGVPLGLLLGLIRKVN